MNQDDQLPALLLIDIQQAFQDVAYWGGERNNPDAEAKAAQLLDFWRDRNWPVFHAQHDSTNPQSPLHPSHSGNSFHPLVAPLSGETVIRKNVNSAFIGTDLQERLEKAGINKLVIAGLTTDHCVSTTVRMAANLGFETVIVADASATFAKKGFDGKNFAAETIHQTALASLHNEFATVYHTEELLRQLASSLISS